MSMMIIGVLLGLTFAYAATQNTELVTLQLAGYALSLPLYLVALGALLIGLLMAWMISGFHFVSEAMTIQDKNTLIKTRQKEVDDLKVKLRELELENARLRGEKSEVVDEPREVVHDRPRNIIERIKHNLSVS